MAPIPPQLIDDYSDHPPNYAPWAVFLKSRRIRGIWFGMLVICPVAMTVLGLMYQRPRGTFLPVGVSFPTWPADAVGVLFLAHLILSVIAAVASFWMWGQHWFRLGWVYIGFALALAVMAVCAGLDATTGVSL